MGWRNWLEEEVEVVLTVLNQAAEAAYSVQASHWSGGKGRPEEGDTADLIISLVARTCWPLFMRHEEQPDNLMIQILSYTRECRFTST